MPSDWTERRLLDLLWARLCTPTIGGPPRFVMAEHVRHDPTYGRSIADAIGIDTWGSGRYALDGYEVKCTRSDWRRELVPGRDGTPYAKSLPWRQHSTRWWVLAPHGVVPRVELPPGWGLLEASTGGRLRCTVQPVKQRDVVPLGARQVAGLMRATATTAAYHTRAST